MVNDVMGGAHRPAVIKMPTQLPGFDTDVAAKNEGEGKKRGPTSQAFSWRWTRPFAICRASAVSDGKRFFFPGFLAITIDSQRLPRNRPLNPNKLTSMERAWFSSCKVGRSPHIAHTALVAPPGRVTRTAKTPGGRQFFPAQHRKLAVGNPSRRPHPQPRTTFAVKKERGAQQMVGLRPGRPAQNSRELRSDETGTFPNKWAAQCGPECRGCGRGLPGTAGRPAGLRRNRSYPDDKLSRAAESFQDVPVEKTPSADRRANRPEKKGQGLNVVPKPRDLKSCSFSGRMVMSWAPGLGKKNRRGDSGR